MQFNKFLGRASVIAICALSLSACADKMYYGSDLGQTGSTGTTGTTGTTTGATGASETGLVLRPDP